MDPRVKTGIVFVNADLGRILANNKLPDTTRQALQSDVGILNAIEDYLYGRRADVPDMAKEFKSANNP